MEAFVCAFGLGQLSRLFPGSPAVWPGCPRRVLWESTSLSASAQSERGQKENTTRFWNWIFQPVPKTCRRAKCSGKQMRSPLSQRCAAPKWLNGLNLIYLNRTWGLFSRMLQHKYLWFTLTLQFFCWFLYL